MINRDKSLMAIRLYVRMALSLMQTSGLLDSLQMIRHFRSMVQRRDPTILSIFWESNDPEKFSRTTGLKRAELDKMVWEAFDLETAKLEREAT